jgi:shikimate kinase
MYRKHLILFLLGPSGCGKTCLGEYLAHEHNWLHLQVDCLEADGIDKLDLRREWNQYFFDLEPKPLINELLNRVAEARKKHVVLSFAGNLIAHMTPERVGALSKQVVPIILTGESLHCKTAFLRRESQRPEPLDEQHWHRNNDGLFEYIQLPHLAQYTVRVFHPDGSFRSSLDLYIELINRIKVFEKK